MKSLEGIKILDLSQKLTGSLATFYLGMYGADVTKLECPVLGDKARQWEPKNSNGSIYFNYLNGGKKSLTLNLLKEEGKEIFKKLVPKFDVICVDKEAGYMDSIGLGYETIKKLNSNIIYASYSYYGETGPYKNKPGSSLTVQAKGVAMDMTGVINEYPVQAAPSIAEHYGASYLASGIVMALIDKKIKGIGQKVDVSLLDSIYSCIEAAPAAYSTVKEIHKRKGNFDPSCAPYDSFKTSDGYVAIGVATQAQWVNLCNALNFIDLLEDPRFVDNEGRRTDYLNVLRPLLAERIIKHKKGDIENECKKFGVPCCAVLTIPEITDLPNTIENGYISSYNSKTFGQMKYPTVPFELSETRVEEFKDAPELGENTHEILSDLGYEDSKIDALAKSEIV